MPSEVSRQLSNLVAHRGLLFSGLALLSSKVITVVSTLVITGVLARLLSPQDLGHWAVLLAIFNILQFLDFGAGMALRNRIAQSNASDCQDDSPYELFSAAFQFYFVAAVILALLIFAFWLTTHVRPAGANSAYMVVVLAAVLCVPFSLVASTCYSYLETRWNAFFDSCLAILRVAGVLGVAALSLTLLEYAMVFYLPAIAIGILSMVAFIWRRHWRLKLVSLEVIWHTFLKLRYMALGFAVLQAASLIMSNIDTIIIAHVVSKESAGDYFVVQKLFFLLVTVHMVLIQSYWSAYTIKYERGDLKWIKKTLDKSFLLMIMLHLIASAFMLLYGEMVIKLWTGRAIDAYNLMPALCVWSFATSMANHYSVFLNSIFQLRFQSIIVVAGAAVGVLLSLVLGERFGAPGVAWASAMVAVPIALLFRYRATSILVRVLP